MKFDQVLVVLAVVMLQYGSQGECTPVAMPVAAELPHGGRSMKQTAGNGDKAMERALPAPGAWEHGFPIPAGARRNDALGGATSLAPGKNYTLKVYDLDAVIDAVAAFYEHHLPAATRTSGGQETKFTVPGGLVRLAPMGKGTRITLIIGPL